MNSWKRSAIAIGLLVASIVIVGPAIYFFAHATEDSYVQGALGNLLATVVGLIVGIPIALEINRASVRHQSAAAARMSQDADERNRNQVLEVLERELQSAIAHIYQMRDMSGTQNGGLRGVGVGSIRNEAWKALSASGDLRYIDDVEIIAALSEAYFRISISRSLELKALDLKLDTSWNFGGGPAAIRPQLRELIGYLDGEDGNVLSAGLKAIGLIQVTLGKATG